MPKELIKQEHSKPPIVAEHSRTEQLLEVIEIATIEAIAYLRAIGPAEWGAEHWKTLSDLNKSRRPAENNTKVILTHKTDEELGWIIRPHGSQ